MKKIFTLTTACIILCLVFASCKSNLSMTKRHYNNGYYIAHSKGKQNPTVSKEEEGIVQRKASLSSYSIKQSAEKKATNSSKLQNANTITAASTVNPENKIAPTTITKPVVNAKTGIIRYSPQIKSKEAKNNRLVIKDDDDKDGLSLFWIVILVIVILWAVGFLAFGLGILIHLLLLVALILLILWLLRVI